MPATAPSGSHADAAAGPARGPAASEARALPRRPMAWVRRVSLLAREVRERVPDAALRILLDAAEVVAEGGVDRGGYSGSVMLTVDLAACADLRDCDAAAARRAAALLAGDARVREAACRIARREAERSAGAALAGMEADVTVRAQGTRIHIDLDVEGRVR